ncbi:hypothetical protein EYF80_041010 [Liparis tanakae]|uniref:Uncharacterized protein n=1 Tax=Liparis tanakae TaxID=230148 RepID=A0A4Z2G695_9TELE|nr:hypothetical protein EYF80_041010 [Liparis tanakae]
MHTRNDTSMEAIPSNVRSDRRKKKDDDDDDDEFKVLIINVADGSRPPTDSTQERRDGVPDADAAHAEPLTDGQLQDAAAAELLDKLSRYFT